MKKLLIGLALLIALAIAAAVATPFLVPAEVYKAQLITAVKRATGRDFEIDGPISLHLFPQLEFQADDASFGNVAGGIARNLAQLKSIKVRLRLKPLLNGHIAIDNFVLDRPVIALEVDSHGRSNWEFGGPAIAEKGGSAALQKVEALRQHRGIIALLAGLQISNLEIRDGTVSYSDARTGKRRAATSINMRFAMANLDSRFTAEGSAVWNGEPVKVEVSITRPSAFESSAPTPMTLGIFAPPLHFAFSGEGAGAPALRLAGDVDLSIPSVKAFAKWAGHPLGDVNGFGPLTIMGKLDLQNGRYAFGDATIAFDAIKGRGGIQFDDTGKRLHIRGSLALGALDLNPYLGAAPAAPPPERPDNGATLAPSAIPFQWSDAPINTAPLRILDADFFFGFDSIRYHNVTVGKSSVIFQLKNGRLTTDLTELALYGGQGKGRVMIDGSGPVSAIDESFELKGVKILPLLRDADDVTLLSGIGNLDMAVEGSGKSQRAVIASLSGHGSLHLDQGALRGVDIVNMVKSRTAAIALDWIGMNQESVFAGLNATYTVTNGVLENTDLRMDLPGLPTSGAGTVDLLHENVNYHLVAKLNGSIVVPVDVRGPWNHLTYKPGIRTTLENFLPDWIINLFGLGK
jgi:AsmA protein